MFWRVIGVILAPMTGKTGNLMKFQFGHCIEIDAFNHFHHFPGN